MLVVEQYLEDHVISIYCHYKVEIIIQCSGFDVNLMGLIFLSKHNITEDIRSLLTSL